MTQNKENGHISRPEAQNLSESARDERIEALESRVKMWRLTAIVLACLLVAAVVVFFFVDLDIGIADAREMQIKQITKP